MSRPRPNAALFARYMLLQIPGMFVAGVVLALLVQWGQITTRLAWTLFGFWVLLELVMFPVTRIAYDTGGRPQGADALLGSLAVAQDDLVPGRLGYVRLGPELWKALVEGDTPVPRGGSVRVAAVRDLTLHVVPVDA